MKNCSGKSGKQLPYSICHTKVAHNRLRKWRLNAKEKYTPPDKNKTYPLDILINTRDRLDSLPLVLIQLANQKVSPFRLLIRDETKKPVINDTSVQNALYLLKQKGHMVVYWRGYRHGGEAFYRRQTLLKASAPLVLFLDDDILLDDPEIITKMLKDLRRYPSAFYVNPCFNLLNTNPHDFILRPVIHGSGLGCVLFRRDWLTKAGAFDYYKLYRDMKIRNQDFIICTMMSYLYGPGRRRRYPTYHLELFRKRPRSEYLGLNNPINTFSYIWIKSYYPHYLQIIYEFLYKPHQLVSIDAATTLLEKQEPPPESSSKPMPPSLTAMHRSILGKKHPGLFSSSNQSQPLNKLIQILTDIRQDVHHSFIYHYLSKRPEWHPKAVKKFRALMKYSKNHHILSQSARILAQLGNKANWQYLLNKARKEPSLLKVYIVYCLIRSTSREFILKAAKSWSKSRNWVDKLLALSMAQAAYEKFPHKAEKIILNLWQDNDELIQWKAIDTLGKLKRLQLLNSLISSFHRFDNARKSQLIRLLGKKGTAKHFSLLLSVLDNSRSSQIRTCAASSLVELLKRYQKSDLSRIKARLASLVNQDKEPDPAVRSSVVRDLSQIPQSWARRIILKAINDKSDTVQSSLIFSLNKFRKLDIYLNQKITKDFKEVEKQSLWHLGEAALASGRFDLCKKFFMPPSARLMFGNILPWYLPNIPPFNISSDHMNFLFGKIEKGKIYEKLFAVSFIGHGAGKKKMLPVFLKFLDSKDFATGLLAAYLLSTLKCKKALPCLVQALQKRDDNIKLIALWGLGQLNSPQTSKILSRYLNHRSTFLRLAALRSLRPEKSNKKLLIQLSKIIKDKDVRVRLYTVEALRKFYHKEDRAKELLYRAIYDRNFAVRDRAFEILKSRLKSSA
ncbi:MAG: HEAT repeat domain-containing protein [Deltaproteobacteria bacterium]|nr:HEAT repeat domain-containing protein [Deltaproteobacteria bacterium]